MQGSEEESVDAETGLPSRFGWEAVLETEEQRARRHGGLHGLFLVRLEPAAPDRRLVEEAALAITGALRETDFLARVDARTFGVLALHCEDLERVADQTRIALGPDVPVARIEGRSAGTDLRHAWQQMMAAAGVAPSYRYRDHPAFPEPAPPVRYVDFVAPPPTCLN